MAKQFSAPLQAAKSKLFNWQIPLPIAISTHFLSLESKRRVVCVLNGQDAHQCALTPIGQGVYVIKVNQKRIKQLALEEGQMVLVELFPDNSKYGLPMPSEMQAVLEEDKQANEIFHQLTAGKGRTLLYIVGQGKNEEDRLFRAVRVLEHLKERNGKIDYKKLNHDLMNLL